tara:strand:- start:996 stop:1205 length:210 start_codon:yes stop_codon:yes gene_type:complete
MNDLTILSATLIASISFSIPYFGSTTPNVSTTPTATVTIVDDEVEIEYLPAVTVTVVDDEVEIEYIPEG